MCFCCRIVGVTQTLALGSSGYLHGLNVQRCSPAANLPPYAGMKGTTTEVASHDAPSNVILARVSRPVKREHRQGLNYLHVWK